MTKLAALIARVPRLWLFAAAGLIQVFFIALMVGDRVYILRTGTEVILKTRAVDPRDLLRGDYVTLNYDISSVQTGALKDTPSKGKGSAVYVKLAKDTDGFYKAVSAHTEPVPLAPGEALIRGFVSYGVDCGAVRKSFCDGISLNYGLESFFVPQGEGREIEKARNDGKLTVIAAVTRSGKAAIKRLLIDGSPVYDEPLF
jgi:uncharacterized membrane-anchored protein